MLLSGRLPDRFRVLPGRLRAAGQVQSLAGQVQNIARQQELINEVVAVIAESQQHTDERLNALIASCNMVATVQAEALQA
jgi:hypothetical protein